MNSANANSAASAENTANANTDSSTDADVNNTEYVDATKYKLVVANDPFHPGQLIKLLIDPHSIESAQVIGYGDLDNVRTPIVRIFYKNGTVEEAFDIEGKR